MIDQIVNGKDVNLGNHPNARKTTAEENEHNANESIGDRVPRADQRMAG